VVGWAWSPILSVCVSCASGVTVASRIESSGIVIREANTLVRRSNVSRNDLPPARDDTFALGLMIFWLHFVDCGATGLKRVARIEVSADPKLEIES
jgi:hypothetical protein